MDALEISLRQILELIKKKDYINIIKIIDGLEELNNEELNKYLTVLMDLLSVITELPVKQSSIIKNLSFEEIKMSEPNSICSDIEMENKKRALILQRSYSVLMKEFDSWDSNVYQEIMKILITLASKSEKAFKNSFLDNINQRNYEQAKTMLENKSERQRLKKVEKVALILLEKIIVFMNSKQMPKTDFFETTDYIQAISHNEFELAFKLAENYDSMNNINSSQNPIYLLLRDICKVLHNIEAYNNFCKLNNNLNADNEESDFLGNKYNEIIRYGLVTVKYKNKNKIAKILKDLIEYPDVSSFFIYDGEVLVLKYSPYVNNDKKIPELMSSGNRLNNKGNTKAALKKYLEALKYDGVKALTYSRVGLSFVALKSFSRAVEYLKVAMELGKNENIVYDFFPLIARLEGKLVDEDIKPHFSSRESRFNFEDTQYNFGLGDLTDITNSIIESGLDVESACINLGISSENIELIKLVYAREFFSRGEETLAEKFMKSVEQSENKTARVTKALKEVRNNKRMYLNKRETTMSLSLKLKPKKSK